MEENSAPVESSNTAEVSPSSEAPSSFSVPDAYSGEKWAQNITSLDGLFKEHANLQSMIGSRPPSIPSKDAGDEAWDQYLSHLKPENADAYNFDLPEVLTADNIPEETRKEITEALSPYKEMMFEAGLSERQASALMNKVLQAEVEGKNLGKSVTGPVENLRSLEEAQQDEQFRTSLKGLYGEESSKAVTIAREFVSNQPDEIKQAFSSLNNEQALGLVKILYDQHKAYNTQDRAVVAKSPYAGMDRSQHMGELAKINVEMMTLAKNTSQYKELERKREDLRKQASRA